MIKNAKISKYLLFGGDEKMTKIDLSRWKHMTIRQKGRVLSLAAIAFLLIWAVWQYGNDIREMTVPIENVTECYVDGTDFSPIMNLLVDSTNGFLSAVMIVLNVVEMCVFSLILLVPWRLIAVRKL